MGDSVVGRRLKVQRSRRGKKTQPKEKLLSRDSPVFGTLARPSDVMIIDCSRRFDNVPMGVQEVAEVARSAELKHVLLSHFLFVPMRAVCKAYMFALMLHWRHLMLGLVLALVFVARTINHK